MNKVVESDVGVFQHQSNMGEIILIGIQILKDVTRLSNEIWIHEK